MDKIQAILEKQRTYFDKGATRNVVFRKRQLIILRNAIKTNESLIMEALKMDLNKSAFEAYATEIGMVLEEIRYMLNNIDRLAKPKRVRTPLMHFPSHSKVYQEPYGSVLIMSPWNYPFQLALAPLVGAIAAGNCAIIKPSNYSPHTSSVIKRIVSENFMDNYITVIEGNREVNQSLLEHKFDYIFFTGSVSVGKIVMAAAARHLTPVTLELGGKSPCIVDRTADIPLSAKRIVWGKLLNSGQTCVAPDYILVYKGVKQQLIREIRKNIVKFYGTEPQNNPDYPKIINQKHFDRLVNLLGSGEIVCGGGFNRDTNQIEPTVLDRVTWASPVMQEEIFGPILPIIEFDSLHEVVKQVNSRPKPLALYYFTRSRKNEKYILEHISSGGACVNDTMVHLVTSYMAFGGVGESGMGSYHGENSFRTFSHSKGVMKKSLMFDVPLRYPPFKNQLMIVRRILR